MRKVTQNTDGSLEIKVTDTRTIEERLKGGLTFKEKLEAAYPTPEVAEITKGWESYDEHKFYK